MTTTALAEATTSLALMPDFLDPIKRHSWRRWKYDWITPAKSGRYTLLARATAADRRAQPDGHNPNFGSYVIDHPLPIDVFVAES